ncbi:unnamed protein product, partial [Brassica rapa]
MGLASWVLLSHFWSLPIPCLVLPVRCLLYLGSSSGEGWFLVLAVSVSLHR